MAQALGTEQGFLISVNIDGTDFGIFDSRKGGDAQAKVTKHRPGGMGPEVSYPALPTYSDLTVSRVFNPVHDLELIRGLEAKAGRVQMTVTEQPLDADGNVFGNPLVYSGTFSNLKLGQVDSTSEKVRMYELDMSVASVV